MAVFGFNLTVSIIGLFFLRKLIPVFDLPSKLLTGFYRFYAPSENDCRQAAQLKPKNVKTSKRNQNVQSKDFVIPKVISINKLCGLLSINFRTLRYLCILLKSRLKTGASFIFIRSFAGSSSSVLLRYLCSRLPN